MIFTSRRSMVSPAIAEAGFEVWELRYPNDQGIDRSADFLAEHWPALPDDRPVILVGHSMGGLVARDFITRWRHPFGESPPLEGAPIAGLIMIGTPNQGSPWARLRIWLELREHFEDAQRRRFSLFAGLRDGLGEAKIDLRPGSAFLEALNARPWPVSVPCAIIGAQLLESLSPWSQQRPAQPDDEGVAQSLDRSTERTARRAAARSAPAADRGGSRRPRRRARLRAASDQARCLAACALRRPRRRRRQCRIAASRRRAGAGDRQRRPSHHATPAIRR